MNIEDLKLAIDIMQKYNPINKDVEAQYQEVSISGPTPSEMTNEDVLRLHALKWFYSSQHECWMHNT